MDKRVQEATDMERIFCLMRGEEELPGVGNYPHTPACQKPNLPPVILPSKTGPHPAVRSLVRRLRQTLSN